MSEQPADWKPRSWGLLGAKDRRNVCGLDMRLLEIETRILDLEEEIRELKAARSPNDTWEDVVNRLEIENALLRAALLNIAGMFSGWASERMGLVRTRALEALDKVDRLGRP